MGTRSLIESGTGIWAASALAVLSVVSATSCSTAPAAPASTKSAATAPASTSGTATPSSAASSPSGTTAATPEKSVHAPVSTPKKKPVPASTTKPTRAKVESDSSDETEDEEVSEKASAGKKLPVGPRGSKQAHLTDAPNSSLPKALQEVEAKYAKTQTLFAEFSQTNETAATGAKKQSKGIIYAKRPGKIRWETRSPDANLLVSDGRKFWFYTPPFDESEHGQVVERPANQVQTKLANALLSGSFSVLSEMKIEEKGPSRFILYPKKGVAGSVKRAEIEIDPKRHLIQTVILEHEGGNRSEIHLSQIDLGRKIGEELFNFVPPPNTDRINP